MNAWTSQTVILDLGWTLVHFLWEGLAIAALLAVALRMLKNGAAQTRYLAGCTALMLMAIGPLVTLAVIVHQNQPLVIPNAQAGPGWVEITTRASATLPPMAVGGASVASDANFSRQLEMLFPWLVLGWVFGVCGLSCRLFAGWLRVRRLRSNSAEPLPWTDRFAALARRLGVNRAVRLVQSALVEVPTVIGWLRPVILLPAGCLTGLTPQQLEAIVAHELAHIRRHDYLVNLLQSVVETLLFYHPAVWWVSRRVREERELCCDDLAVAVCGDRVGYARALATLEELRPASAQLALAAGGAPLLQRIRRLAGKPERSAGRASWPVAGISLLLVLGILAAGMREHRAIAQGVRDVSPKTPATVGTNSFPGSASHGDIVFTPYQTTANPDDAVADLTNSLLLPFFHDDRVLTLAQNTPNPADAAGLETRTFHLDPRTFIQAVKSAVPRTGTDGAGADSAAQIAEDVRDYLQANGVDFGTNDGKVVIFNDRMGRLTVRATPQDMHMIEMALSKLPAPAAFVNIKAKFVEITCKPGDTNAFFSFDTPGGPRQVASVTGVLTDQQFRATINALEQRSGTDVLTAPGVVTESGRQAQMQNLGAQTVVFPGKVAGAPYSTSNMLFGQTLDVIATISADKKMISMRLTPSISKFGGYSFLDPTTHAIIPDVTMNADGSPNLPPGKSVIPVPSFSTSTVTANVTVWDGSTVVIGGLVADTTNTAVVKNEVPGLASLPVVGGMFSQTTTQPVKKEIMVFVTADIINPDGTLFHSDEEREALSAGRLPGQGSAGSVNSPSNVFPGAPPQPAQPSTN